MKILFLTNQLEMGGIETNIVRLSRELHADGHSPWTASNGGRLVPSLIEAGGSHLQLQGSRTPRELWRSTRTVAQFMRSERPDIVHTFSAWSSVLWSLSKTYLRLSGGRHAIVPSVSSVMGLSSSPDESTFFTRIRVQLTAWGARRVIVMAPAIDEIIRSLPISKKRLVHTSVVGVDVPPDLLRMRESGRAVREEFKIRPEERIVLTIGNLEPRKSHHLFIEAAGLVLDGRDDVVFLIVGEGHLRGTLEKQIEGTAGAKKIRLLGVRDEIDPLLAACDVYVRPGIVEGFIGITVLEAQAQARPVVSFTTEDVKLAISDGETGRLVPKGDVVALAQVIDELLQDPLQAAKLGENGRCLVQDKYSIAGITADLVELYSTLVGHAAG